MSEITSHSPRRVLIASANPIFGKGLQKVYSERWGKEQAEFHLSANTADALTHLESWQPDLVIVDYDDQTIHREEFLGHFVAGNRSMQVMLVSLQDSGTVVVYDRRSLTQAQAEDWLNLPWQPGSNFLQPKRSGNMKHFVIVGVLVAVFTVLVNWLLTLIGLLPVEASAQAIPIDRLFNAHFWVISFLFSLIMVFMVYSLIVFRSKPGEKQEGVFFKNNSGLEVVWTVIPLGVVIAFSFFGARALADVRRVDPQAMKVKVTAFQWGWSFEYPAYGVTSNTLYLPVNRQVELEMTSRDVIHSFWVPEFRVKQDILPGANFVKTLRITPNKEGKYTLLCAELCGGAHAYMTAGVVVDSAAAFNQWISDQAGQKTADPVSRGQKWSQTSGCLSCHSVDGKKAIGPTWKGLAGSDVELTDGTTVKADDAYLLKSIVEPNAQIAVGYPPNIMPSTYTQSLTDDQIKDILAYMKSLK